MPTGRVPGVRGRARTQPGWVRSQIQYENRTLLHIFAVHQYADVINFCSSAAPGLFHDLVAPVVRLTTESNACKMQEGSFTRTTGTSTRNSRRSLTMHGLECVGFFALFYFHFTFFILSFIFILRYLHLTLFSFFLVNADQFAETPL